MHNIDSNGLLFTLANDWRTIVNHSRPRKDFILHATVAGNFIGGCAISHFTSIVGILASLQTLLEVGVSIVESTRGAW